MKKLFKTVKTIWQALSDRDIVNATPSNVEDPGANNPNVAAPSSTQNALLQLGLLSPDASNNLSV